MQFVISAASKSSDVAALLDTFSQVGAVPPHVRAVLTTPIFANRLTLKLSRRLQEEFGVPIMFDSGGYAVQTGRIEYFDMYSRLLELYRREQWAGIYTLPDNVPTSRDTDEQVEAKVRQTVECSTLFYREMPPELRDKCLGVVHGRSISQIEYCLDAYLQLGLRLIGFGSFGTSGQDSSINVVTSDALAMARAVSGLARSHGVDVHLFGVGSPGILPWITRTGAASFDSANWARSAGFGQVFLPLTRGYNVSHRSRISSIQRGLTQSEFERLRAISGHCCEYCSSFELLQTSRKARAAHNVLSMVDSLDIVNSGNVKRMDAIYAAASPKYRTLWSEGRGLQ